ncbi:Uma2 family endonuclease, partial [Moorena bouillonii]|uniref:Uma2 family endonuclease n=1 Tax=Moorena bouillonii TaxID=207920 RepID=UPI0018E9CFFF
PHTRSPRKAFKAVCHPVSLQNKMTEYMDNGAKLGWLIDRKHRGVYVYRPGMETERLDNPATVSGEPVLPGFVLKLEKIW